MAKKHLIAIAVGIAILAAGVFAWSRSAASQPYGPGMMGGGLGAFVAFLYALREEKRQPTKEEQDAADLMTTDGE